VVRPQIEIHVNGHNPLIMVVIGFGTGPFLLGAIRLLASVNVKIEMTRLPVVLRQVSSIHSEYNRILS
jgi:hypothetical protein